MPSTIRNAGIKYEKQVGHVDSTINSIGIFSLTNESVGNWGNDDSPINFEVFIFRMDSVCTGFTWRLKAALCFTLFHQQFPSVE